jgi:hypothetical protein
LSLRKTRFCASRFLFYQNLTLKERDFKIKNVINWLNKNKIIIVLILIILFLLVKQYLPTLRHLRTTSTLEKAVRIGIETPTVGGPELGMVPPVPAEYSPVEDENRLVVEESSLSLVVKNVREAADQVTARAKEVGGFMVSTSLSHPEEAPFATVIIRVPADRLRETIDYFRSLAVKVSSEKILGTDVTAEYTDIQARLVTLEETKAKFESILNQATEIQDILQVQREIIRLQDQIDSLKGREKYLEQTAKLAKITVYLSTDELALPYAPAKPFRPSVIFKLAVRSLVLALRKGLTALIWIVVYAVIWLPVVLIIFFIRKRRKKSS